MTRYGTLLICLFYVFDMSTASYLPELKIRTIVNSHNVLRRKVATRWADRGMGAGNIRQMSWDENLAVEAADMAACENLEDDSMGMTSSFGGSILFYDDMESMGHGKNVAVSSSRNIPQMIAEWGSQETHFDYKYRVCSSGHDCDAFMQMIWADASRVGCNLRHCDVDNERVKHFVCMYDEQASIFFDPYLTGPVCSGCPVSAGFCEDSLCVPTCYGSSDNCGCQKTCHHPGIGEGVLDEDTCTCSCVYGLGGDCQDVCENPQYYDDGYDICADINDTESCEAMPAYQRETCPANCHYGCRTAP